jgi:hypothetical protein
MCSRIQLRESVFDVRWSYRDLLEFFEYVERLNNDAHVASWAMVVSGKSVDVMLAFCSSFPPSPATWSTVHIVYFKLSFLRL